MTTTPDHQGANSTGGGCSVEDLRAYIAGQASPEVAGRILKDLENPSSLASRYVEETMTMARFAMDPDNIAWGRLAGMGSEIPEEEG
ncbi:MAG: hypothetical protein PHH13_04410 [Candidatus Peribacteraceae bacterium]|nr:hypothetical protein [Candidatus Peribacteraceae bacterium]